MSSTLMEQLSQKQLAEEINRFIRSRDSGALGTRGPAGLRVSPVRYFLDGESNLFVQSEGGSKFTNLEADNSVCLLISSRFDGDCRKVHGVQFFGQGEVLEQDNPQYAAAISHSPWPVNENSKLIRIHCKHAVYVDRIRHKNLKQEWVPR
ncbi:MAG TPA: pyridoxamine 5'-phosphate oxidase family protein [Firmicutes bacterium]|nr:pyridoxamine 5'-phosphate oxidase family protein [Bacillota bacterium]